MVHCVEIPMHNHTMESYILAYYVEVHNHTHTRVAVHAVQELSLCGSCFHSISRLVLF